MIQAKHLNVYWYCMYVPTQTHFLKMYEMIKVIEKRKHRGEKGQQRYPRHLSSLPPRTHPGPHYYQTAYLQRATSSPCSLTTLPSHTSSSPVLFSGAVILQTVPLSRHPANCRPYPDSLAIRSAPPHRPPPSSFHCG